jgi:pimeloyl-ACP methyl ester carboxylesterase
MEQSAGLSVSSRDGTSIGFERAGGGSPLIFVVGAFNDRTTARPLARSLESTFTVLAYDRRGRGASGDTAPYAIDREVEDLQALIVAAGGSAAVFGYSSGALLALKAAARRLSITRLVLYDPPYGVITGRPGPVDDHAARLAELIAAGRRGDAVEYFQREIVGIPQETVAPFRHAPFRPALEAIAPTLVYDATIVTDRSLAGEVASVQVPTLVLCGGANPPALRTAAQTLAGELPGARLRELAGQGHDIIPEAVAPMVREFLDNLS